MTEAHRIKRLEVNCQIGILHVVNPVPIIEKMIHHQLGKVIHHLIVMPGWSPLWFDYGELGGEVWTAADVATVRVETTAPTQGVTIFDRLKYVFLRWSEHEVAASVMAKWADRPHPIWDWQLDMAAVRPEWEYDTVITNDRDLAAVESISFRRGVLLPPL